MDVSWGSVLLGLVIGGLFGGLLGMLFGSLMAKASMASNTVTELEVLIQQAVQTLPIGEAVHCQFHICHEKYTDEDDGGGGVEEDEPQPNLWERN